MEPQLTLGGYSPSSPSQNQTVNQTSIKPTAQTPAANDLMSTQNAPSSGGGLSLGGSSVGSSSGADIPSIAPAGGENLALGGSGLASNSGTGDSNPFAGMNQQEIDILKQFKDAGLSELDVRRLFLRNAAAGSTQSYYPDDPNLRNINKTYPAPSLPGMAPDGGQYYGDPLDPNNTGNLQDQEWYGRVYQPPELGTPDIGGREGTTVGDDFREHGERWEVGPGGGDLTRGPYQPGKPLAENTVREDGSVQSNYSDTRGNEYRGAAYTAGSMDPMEIERMNAAAAAENARAVAEGEMSGYQLEQLLNSDSPLMQLAAQRGLEMANARGLSNSSMAAGNAMREMTQQMTPFAMQQAEAERQAASQNQTLESSRLESNAGREQQAAAINAAAENQATAQEFGTEADTRRFNAGTQTDVSMGNAQMANTLLNADRQRYYGASMQQLAGDQDYAKQKLASQTGIDIANIEGQYKQLISENDTAARMFDATYGAIGQIVSNPEIYADEAASKVNYLVSTMQNMMNTLLAFEDVDLTLAGSQGEGKNSDFDANAQAAEDGRNAGAPATGGNNNMTAEEEAEAAIRAAIENNGYGQVR